MLLHLARGMLSCSQGFEFGCTNTNGITNELPIPTPCYCLIIPQFLPRMFDVREDVQDKRASWELGLGWGLPEGTKGFRQIVAHSTGFGLDTPWAAIKLLLLPELGLAVYRSAGC
jgi:hypothetical protein